MPSRRSRKQEIQEFSDALVRAARDPEEPQPLCEGHSDRYVDYAELPSAEQAQSLCAPCPLIKTCHIAARAERPVWGIRGGRVWIDRRQAPRK
ncbi:MAG: WhiB family transcriptional regulator [Microbacterium gubbeenense]|uniref:WhiB family transcriptional regulator n=1 Tax=Microbacterium gubbeenense TaxID=159896 RepID=UPI003F999E6E